jgi:trypsin-like peptidase
MSLSDKNEVVYYSLLVTNRHVLEGLDTIQLRFNPQGSAPACEFRAGVKDCVFHPNPEIDIGVVPIFQRVLTDANMQFSHFYSDRIAADRVKMQALGLSEGDGVFVLGFPMGIVGETRSFVIVRSGGIARLRDCLAGVTTEFLLDAFVFPGNSGGPVISRPEFNAILGTKMQDSAHLIGVVKSYVPYRDIAISPQTGNPRIIFEENSGLTSVIPMDYVNETVAAAQQRGLFQPHTG